MVRPANLMDASSLAAISLEVWFGTYIRNGINAFFADYALKQFTTGNFENILSQKEQSVLVSQNSEGIDGFIRISSGVVAPVDGCSDIEISTLYVQPRHQSHGVGRQLLEAGLKLCTKMKRPNVWLSVNAENERATAFYLKHGFKIAGETHFQIGDQLYPNHVLRLCLE